MDEEERERMLQAGRQHLAEFQRKKKAKKSSKKAKPASSAPAPAPLSDGELEDAPRYNHVQENEVSVHRGTPRDVSGDFSVGSSHVLLESEHGLENGPSEGSLPFASDENHDFVSDFLAHNGNVEEPSIVHNDVVNDLRKEVEARQRSEDELRSNLSLQATTIQDLERQLEQCKLASSHDDVVQRLQVQHADVLKRLQEGHDEEIKHVRVEEQRKRAEQVQSLTSRLESQHKEDTDALREQVQHLQATAPNDTGHLQQMAVLMREQYQQESASKDTEHKRELTSLTDKHAQEVASLQQQSAQQMEAFRIQVQESVSAQVNQFHTQYQAAIAELRGQLEQASRQVASLEAEKQELSDKAPTDTGASTALAKLQAANESLSERLSSISAMHDAKSAEVTELRQQLSADTATCRQLEESQAHVEAVEVEKRELLATVGTLKNELQLAAESRDAALHDREDEVIQMQLEEQAAKEALLQELEQMRANCSRHVDSSALENEKALVSTITSDLERALSANGLLESQLQVLQQELDSESRRASQIEHDLRSEVTNKHEDYESLLSDYHQLQQQMQESLAQYARQVEELAEGASDDSAASTALSELRSAYEEKFEQLRLDYESREDSLKNHQQREMADMTARQVTASSSILEELEREKAHSLQVEGEIVRLRDDLRSVAEKRSALETRNTWLEQRVKELTEQNQASIMEAKVRFDEACKQHDTERSSWLETNEGLQQEVAKVATDLSTTRQQLAESEAVAREQPLAADLAAKLEAAESGRHQLQQRISELEAGSTDAGKMEDVTAKLRAEIARLGRQLEEKDAELLERNEECARLEGEISQSLADIDQMQLRLDKMSNDLEGHRAGAGKVAGERNQLEQEVSSLNSRVCFLEKALSEQEESATSQNAVVAELESRIAILQSCEEDLKAARAEVEVLQSRLASLQPPADVESEAVAPVASNRQEQLQSSLEQHKQALEVKLAEKSRLNTLLEEQRSALVQQLMEKTKLESLLQEKNKLESELLRQRSLLEKELSDLDTPVLQD